MKDHKHDQEDFTLKKIRYYQGTVDDFETFWKKKSEQGEAEECPETKACKEINANLNKAFEIVPVAPDDAVSEDEPKEAKKKKKKHDEVNEGVFRNSIIRTSGTNMKRREDSMDYIPVDLGLPSGTLWCDRNVGATSPEDYGGHFQWGGTKDMAEKDYDYDTSPYWNEKKHKFDKYNEIDNKVVLDPEDDAAHVNMGGGWHMPTAEQCKELVKNTDRRPDSVGGVDGWVFKSKKNGNSIFIPCAGQMLSSSFMEDSGIDFNVWSSSVNFDLDSELVYKSASYITSVWNVVHAIDRDFGFSVRGVMDNK